MANVNCCVLLTSTCGQSTTAVVDIDVMFFMQNK